MIFNILKRLMSEIPKTVKNITVGGTQAGTFTQLDDWNYLDPSRFTIASSTTVTTTSGNMDIFEIGDKIRTKQNNTFSYFYLVKKDVDTNTLTLNAGDDYVIDTESDLQGFRFSRFENPTGFPATFKYEPAVTIRTGGDIDFLLPASGRDIYFRMEGRLITVLGTLLQLSVSNSQATSLYVDITFPFERESTEISNHLIRIGAGTGVDNLVGVVSYGGSSDTDFTVQKIDTDQWVNGNTFIYPAFYYIF